MKKVINITLNNIVFYIEEDAFGKLNSYLDSIRKTFAHSADKDEIIADIEGRIAERFQSAVNKAKQAVTTQDVEALIASMGTSADFEQTQGESSAEDVKTETNKQPIKKFYRDMDNAIIGGVASGIGAYFDIDPVFVRLGFILSLFLGGLGVILYIILWLVTPEAQTLSQKMEMQGDPVTLKNLEEAVKEKLKSEPGAKRAVGKITAFLRSVFAGLGKFIRSLRPIPRVLFGSIFTLAGAVAFVSISTAVIGFIISAPSPYMDAEFIRFFLLIPEPYLAPILGALFILAIVPAAFLLLLGISLLRNKNTISGTTTGILISLWIAAMIVTGVGASYIIPRFVPIQNEYRGEHQYYRKQDKNIPSLPPMPEIRPFD